MKTDHFLSHANKIHYREWGPDNGIPIISVHGLTGNSQDFKFAGESLAKGGYKTIAIDMPGRGQSDFLQNPADYNFDFYIEVLNDFLVHLKIEKCIWLGVSMGGLLGIRMAAEQTQKISRLILVDVGPEVPQSQLDFISSYLELAPVFETIEGVVGAMKQSIGTPFYRGPMTEEQWKYFAESSMRKLPDGRYTRSFDPGIAYNFKKEPLGKTDLWDSWEKITQPVLAVRGELSLLFPVSIADEMKKRKPGATMDFATVNNVGHVPSFYPEDQIDIIRQWLARLPE